MSWEGMNRRKFPRVVFPCLVKILEAGEHPESLLTHTVNVSIGGVCVIIKRHLEMFSPVGIEVDLMDGGDPIVCEGKVVWVVRRKAIEEEKPSFYDTGIEFVNIRAIDHERLQKLIEHQVSDRLRTRRKS